ncbi:MAG TPA: amidohydrolase/deacetylase family metallohydrolase [Candidatus Dormibacteraeota bacterium]|nr:amidohydrolase/deacetylase family metallohydrolase [Candidatus Dormibacteraeota bacterium]
MPFDLLVKGGEVIDPGSGRRGSFDVAVNRNRIAAVDRDIPASAAARVVDATGKIVTPGLVDLHTHVFHGCSYWGVRPDPVASRSGVTTWIDAGSAGAMTLEGFREYIVKPARARIYALLNISYIGLVGPDHELMNLNYSDVDLFKRIYDLNRDLVLGLKVRMMSSTVGEQGVKPLERARQAADECAIPMMMHIGYAPPSIDDCLPFLKEGDILTHCFTGFDMRILDEHGKLRDSARAAWERGVVMDIGHGTGAFWFEVAEPLIQQGYKPTVISTDIHVLSIGGPMYDLPTCLNKCIALGMSVDEVVEAATAAPARVMGLDNEVGSLKPGLMADMALFELEQGTFRYYDVNMDMREGHERLRHSLTIVGGRPLEELPVEPPPPWLADDFVWPSFQAGLVKRQREGLLHG